MVFLTRRQATGLLFASTTAALVPAIAAAETEETLAFKLGEALNGRLKRGCNGRFSVPMFHLSGTRKNVVMRASVQMEWPPGIRRRPFRSVGTSQQEAIVAMFQDALVEFGGAWPKCIRV
ncbi:MAG: hypothetical protein HKN27_03685 [Silicimonas sp.]|nr:hypothetical protein [Silicimonas sp.]